MIHDFHRTGRAGLRHIQSVTNAYRSSQVYHISVVLCFVEQDYAEDMESNHPVSVCCKLVTPIGKLSYCTFSFLYTAQPSSVFCFVLFFSLME